jgi:hypothetical protein
VLESVVSSHLRHREIGAPESTELATRVGEGAELERLRGRRGSSSLLAREVLGRTGNWYSSALRPPLRWLGDGGPDAEVHRGWRSGTSGPSQRKRARAVIGGARRNLDEADARAPFTIAAALSLPDSWPSPSTTSSAHSGRSPHRRRGGRSGLPGVDVASHGFAPMRARKRSTLTGSPPATWWPMLRGRPSGTREQVADSPLAWPSASRRPVCSSMGRTPPVYPNPFETFAFMRGPDHRSSITSQQVNTDVYIGQ